MTEKTPKYIQLLKWIEEEIKNGNYKQGDKFYSETELSRNFNLNRQTVRNAIDILNKKGVLERRQGSGTYILHPITDKKTTKKIGMISTYQGSYIFPNIIKGVDSVISESGYTLLFSLTHNKLENEGRALKLMIEEDVDGIIIEPTKSALPNPNKHLFDEVNRKGIPLIFFNANYPNMDFPYVTMDDYEAGKIATKHLFNMGHKKIAGIFQGDDRQGHLRYLGYIDCFYEMGLNVNSKNIMWFTTEDIFYLDKDFERVLRYIEGCTAIVCYNDQIAYSIFAELKKRNIRVPYNISMVGIDDSELALMCEVPLTSVAHPMEELGVTVARKILELLENPLANGTVKFTPKLVTRNSVRRLK